MTAKFEILFKGDHLEVHSDGEKDMDYVRRVWKQVFKACERHKCYKVLGIANTTKPVSVVDGYEHASMLQEIGYPPRMRVAWVELNPEFFDVIAFVETVLFNRGIGLMKGFQEVEEARKWLFSDEGV